MKALHYVDRNELEWRELEDPVIRDETDAILKPLAVADTDVFHRRPDLHHFPDEFMTQNKRAWKWRSAGNDVSIQITGGDRQGF